MGQLRPLALLSLPLRPASLQWASPQPRPLRRLTLRSTPRRRPSFAPRPLLLPVDRSKCLVDSCRLQLPLPLTTESPRPRRRPSGLHPVTSPSLRPVTLAARLRLRLHQLASDRVPT